MIKTLLVLHYPQEIAQFQEVLLGDVTVIYDTRTKFSNQNKFTLEGAIEVGVPYRPWWYILARECDDYRFYQKIGNTPYYTNRAYESYKYKRLVKWPLGFLKYFYRPPTYVINMLA